MTMKARRPTETSLLDTVRETVDRHGLIDPGDALVVAVSGGPDSLALLHLLTRLRSEWSLRLVAAHLHHGMRAAGDEDAAFVAATAQQWGVTVIIGHEDVPLLAKTRRIGSEEAGRIARYGFLARVAAEQQCRRIATAHTADDRAETVLLNLCRGTGIAGLAGIPARRPASPEQTFPEIVRPLRDCRRQAILAYCAAHSLEPRWDVTNESREPARNRVRQELLPWLERELSPTVRAHLLRLADLAEEESALLQHLAEELLEEATANVGEDELQVRISPLAAAPPALARRALLAALGRLGGPTAGRNRVTLAALMGMLGGALKTGIAVPESALSVTVQADLLVLRRIPDPGEASPEFERTLSIPGTTACPEWRLHFEAQLAAAPVEPRRDVAREVVLDWDRLRPPLTVRNPRAGDRVVPLGMTGHRKLQDLFTDHKIPRARRGRVPIILDNERIVWVVGVCVSDEVKLRTETREVLHLTLYAGPSQA